MSRRHAHLILTAAVIGLLSWLAIQDAQQQQADSDDFFEQLLAYLEQAS